MPKRTGDVSLVAKTRKVIPTAIDRVGRGGLSNQAHTRPTKQQITLRVDTDVIAWFKANHPRYQTLMNGVLRREMTEAIFEEERQNSELRGKTY